MKPYHYLSLLAICVLLSGCAGTTRVVTDAVAAGAGGLIGHKISKGDPFATAAGAGAGLILGETLNYANDHRTKSAYTTGFNKGRSDAVKQQYWIMVNQQKAVGNHAFDESISLFDLPLPERETDGILFNASNKVLRLEE